MAAWQRFFQTSLEEKLARYRQTGSEASFMTLFHTVAQTVPAYRAFLAAHSITPQEINSLDDFRRLPLAVGGSPAIDAN